MRITSPSDTSELNSNWVEPTGVSPASLISRCACATSVPAAITGTCGRPVETVTATPLPRGTCTAAAGSVAMTEPSGTLSSPRSMNEAVRSASVRTRSALDRSNPTTDGISV